MNPDLTYALTMTVMSGTLVFLITIVRNINHQKEKNAIEISRLKAELETAGCDYYAGRSRMNLLASPSDYTTLTSVTLGDTSFTKYRYHDGFDDEPKTYTFWAVTGNGAEVWYDDERLYDALDEIERLRAELEKFSYADTINGMELWEKCDDPVD